jgi:hypothetical protein
MKVMRSSLFFLPLLLLAAGSFAAGDRSYALLVGVSRYPSLDAQQQLKGPANDVRLYQQLLQERGVPPANIRLLADGVDGAALPTRTAIMQSFEELAAQARDGDFVFVFFAGHGSQQPEAVGMAEEADGLDEIFLPRDVGRWESQSRSVKNALTDNDIGAAIQRIQARGAFVWAVFDTCHAGTMARGAPLAYQHARQVSPGVLGIDAQVIAAAAAKFSGKTRGVARDQGALAAVPAGSHAGGYAYTYAAHSYEQAPEISVPEADNTYYGLLSYTLYQVIARHPGITYRQAIEEIAQNYLSRNLQMPTPLQEGSALDAVVFGNAETRPVAQWRMDRDIKRDVMQLHAGRIHGVTPGSILAVVPAAASGSDSILGYVRVTQAQMSQSGVEPVAYANKPALELGADVRSVYARPVHLAADSMLRVSLRDADGYCDKPVKPALLALETLQADKALARRVQWSQATQLADVYLCQKNDRLLFLTASGSVEHARDGVESAVALPLHPAATTQSLAVAIKKQLLRISRVTDLTRLAAAYGGGRNIDARLILHPKCESADSGCDATPATIDVASREMLRDGDTISVELANNLLQPVDVTVLYVDAAYGMTLLYPARSGELPRLDNKTKRTFDIVINASPSGFERMLIVAVPATPQSPVMSFAHLAQEAMLESDSRGAGQAGAESIVSYAWTVMPRGAGKNPGKRFVEVQ